MTYFKARQQQKVAELKEVENFDYPTFIRTDETGDRVYFVEGDNSHWIENPETLEALGGGFDQVETIPFPFFRVLTSGKSLNMENYETYKEAV